MARPYSATQIDKLGRRLAGEDDVTPEDRVMFETLLESHDEALASVSRIIADATGLTPTGRLKTLATLRDKVARGTRLSKMQDVAGLRLVLPAGESRLAQDDLAHDIERAFPSSRRSDRRAQPSDGYRALHIIVEVEGCFVEIQIRTHLQHIWAEVMERLGDLWGRQIRYGGEPDDPGSLSEPERAESSSGIRTRAETVEALRMVAGTIAHYEVIELAMLAAKKAEGLPTEALAEVLGEGVVRALRKAAEYREDFDRLTDDLRSTLEEIRDSLPR